MAEWSKALVLKTRVSEMGPWVRIPLPPPIFTFARNGSRVIFISSPASTETVVLLEYFFQQGN